MNTSSQENLTTHNSEQLHVEHHSEVDSRFPKVIRAVRLNRKGRGLRISQRKLWMALLLTT